MQRHWRLCAYCNIGVPNVPGFICEERLTYGPWSALERALARAVQHAGFTEVSLVGGAGVKGADVVGVVKG